MLLVDSHPMGTQEGERGEAVTGPGPGVDELATRSQSHHVNWVLLLTSAFGGRRPWRDVDIVYLIMIILR